MRRAWWVAGGDEEGSGAVGEGQEMAYRGEHGQETACMQVCLRRSALWAFARAMHGGGGRGKAHSTGDI